MEQDKSTIFRKKTLDRIASPEQLTDHLRATNPGMWAVLLSFACVAAGVAVWTMAGPIEYTIKVKVIAEDGSAVIIPTQSSDRELKSDMSFRVGSDEYEFSAVKEDKESGQAVGYAPVTLGDGSYDAVIILDETDAFHYLLRK